MLRNLAGFGPSETGLGRSANGASSFHLAWEMPLATRATRLVEVSGVLEVLVPPRVQALYFWALQVDLGDAQGVWGTGHTGLQWNPRYPGNAAINWGGYASAMRGGAVLPGTPSAMPGFSDDPNTLAYAWLPGRPYRLRVFPSAENPNAWRAEVTDLMPGSVQTIRELTPPPGHPSLANEGYLARPVVWSEVFAGCEAPSVTVRWSGLQAVDEHGRVVRPEAVRVNYQAPEAGGCSNTSVAMDEAGGLMQVTSVPRLVEQGTVLKLP